MSKNYNNSMNISKTVAIATILSLSFVATSAFAQEATSTTSGGIRKEVKIERKDTRDLRKENMKEVREERKEVREERKEERKEIRDDRKENVKEIRQEFKEERKEMRGEIKEMRKDGRASSTEMFKAKMNEKREMAKKMKANIFDERKNALVKELKLSVTNLTNISGRIQERITKLEADGKDVSSAKAALETAVSKIEAAKTAISVFENVSYSTNTTASSTTEIDLDKPRIVGDSAIKSVKEARDSLKKVVEIINSIK